MGALTRIIVVDDHPIVGRGLVSTFENEHHSDVTVVGVCSSIGDALAQVRAHMPDVVLCDIMIDRRPVGLDLLSQLRALLRPPAVVMLTAFDEPALVREALSRGAAGYLPKSASVADIIQAITVAASGRPVFSDAMLRRAGIAPAPPSPRELSILLAVAAGSTNGEVARALGLSTKTVEGYLHSLYARLGVASRTELVTLAISVGWLSVDDITLGYRSGREDVAPS